MLFIHHSCKFTGWKLCVFQWGCDNKLNGTTIQRNVFVFNQRLFISLLSRTVAIALEKASTLSVLSISHHQTWHWGSLEHIHCILHTPLHCTWPNMFSLYTVCLNLPIRHCRFWYRPGQTPKKSNGHKLLSYAVVQLACLNTVIMSPNLQPIYLRQRPFMVKQRVVNFCQDNFVFATFLIFRGAE